MPILSVKEFAEITHKKPKDIHSYVAQNKLVKSKEGRIDTMVAINAAFLLKHSTKRDQSDTEELETGMSSTKSEGESGKAPAGAYFLDELKGQLLKVNISKGKIDLEKKHGEVFPIELVKELVMRQGKSLTEAFKQLSNQMLDMWAIKFKIPNGEVIKAIKAMAEGLNKSQLEAIEKTKTEMKGIARDFGNKRGIGEHGAQS